MLHKYNMLDLSISHCEIYHLQLPLANLKPNVSAKGLGDHSGNELSNYGMCPTSALMDYLRSFTDLQ